MLYKKNGTKVLSDELFRNPTCEYRGTPFWAWNATLRKDELLWQIDRLKEMGFGGYHMHTRSGMATKYLSEEFMDLIKACNEHGKQEKMLSWLYDEDRWPSGAAGGIVTKNPKYRQKCIYFTQISPDTLQGYGTDKIAAEERVSANLKEVVDPKTGYETGKPYLLACYNVELNGDGTLKSYEKTEKGAPIVGKRWYAYVCTPQPSGWYNNQTYVDTLDKEAMAEFIRVTYEAYKKAVGEDFGGSIPAIFTDEPQFQHKETLSFADSDESVRVPWTTTAEETFKERYGYSIVERLPELFWNLAADAPSQARYHYHDHICQLFTEAFADQCGAWCDKNGLALTGHMLHEDWLRTQTCSLGEAMRAYRSFGIPGIDMLCDEINLSTAKQTQSAVHQYGKEAMLSELYGVTGWEFDFRGHKFQGDWQAALGVTVRVPHLSWVSMKGSAKRDYPASIHYQSCWYRKYAYVEDHFARVNTAMTRGVPDVKVAMIHPIESYWINLGPRENTAALLRTIEDNFQNITRYLLRNTIDFDYISESLLPELYQGVADRKFGVGKMVYSAVVVPPLVMLRQTTIDALSEFVKQGGKVIFTGDCPCFVDGKRSEKARALYDTSIKVPFSPSDICNALAEEREVTIKHIDGNATDNLIYQMRKDGDRKWMFVCRCDKPATSIYYDPAEYDPERIVVKLKGNYKVTLYDTISGEIKPIAYGTKGGYTTFRYDLYASDSLLVALDPTSENDCLQLPTAERKQADRVIDCKGYVDYALSEPNVLVLDLCEWSWDRKTWNEREEILRIDQKIRETFGYPMADGRDCQPWAIEEEKIDKFPYLRFVFDSETEAACRLAFEEATEVVFNGENVAISADGYFTDKDIHTMKMPPIKKGKNELIVRVPISKRISMENLFLLGDFGVRVEGATSIVTAKKPQIAFGSITTQGMPFYGAAITYKMPIETKDCDLRVCASYYKGALIGVKLDGKDVGNIVYAPFALDIPNVAAGKHKLELTLYATRVNSFGMLHCCSNVRWKGPRLYYTDGALWSYEYDLKNVGIMKSPVIEVFEK